jgi:hypothetical protein
MPCFLRFVVNDDLRIEETIEACNALKEYRILIQTGEKEKVCREGAEREGELCDRRHRLEFLRVRLW